MKGYHYRPVVLPKLAFYCCHMALPYDVPLASVTVLAVLVTKQDPVILWSAFMKARRAYVNYWHDTTADLRSFVSKICTLLVRRYLLA